MAKKSLNKVQLIGHVGKDPDIRTTSGGKTCASFSFATNETWDGKDHTSWHNIVAWNKIAEIIGEHVRKGSCLYLEGKLQTRSWDADDGTKRYTTEVIVNDIIFLGDGNGGGRRKGEAPPPDDDDAPNSAPTENKKNGKAEAKKSDVKAAAKPKNTEVAPPPPEEDIPF